MFANVNIKDALNDQRQQRNPDILDQVQSLFRKEERSYAQIEQRLDSKGDYRGDLGDVMTEDIFDIEDIRKVAIRYDLRFLDSSLFVGDIPAPALQLIRERETSRGATYKSFKILAPGELFQLEDENADPLLFGERADGRYELIAQWGGDISWLRALKTYPKRNVLTLISFVVLGTLLFVGLTPDSVLEISGQGGHQPIIRPVYFFFMLTFFSGVTGYIWFAFRNQFSSQSWDSKSF